MNLDCHSSMIVDKTTLTTLSKELETLAVVIKKITKEYSLVKIAFEQENVVFVI